MSSEPHQSSKNNLKGDVAMVMNQRNLFTYLIGRYKPD